MTNWNWPVDTWPSRAVDRHQTSYVPAAGCARNGATTGAVAPVSLVSGASATAPPAAALSLMVVTASSGCSENQSRTAAGADATVSLAAGSDRSRCRCRAAMCVSGGRTGAAAAAATPEVKSAATAIGADQRQTGKVGQEERELDMAVLRVMSV